MCNVSNIQNCYGCGVCTKACPKKIIHLHLNEYGFYEPYIADKDSCTHCGLCLDVCSYTHSRIASEQIPMAYFAGWSLDLDVQKKSSSGGITFEICKHLLSLGYKICAVRYNVEKERAEHYIATSIEELKSSLGSKYLPSFTEKAFNEIDKRQKYLVIGTPCQIDSFRRYIRKFRCEENFILLDFFCHGVPSMLMWKKYLDNIELKVGKVNSVSWRNKQTGWHDSWAMHLGIGTQSVDWHDSYNMLIREKKSFYACRRSEGDLFYKFFLGNICLGDACYNKCKFKINNSSADIRVGDLWGEKYASNELGVSAIIAFSKKAIELLRGCNIKMNDEKLEVIAEGQMKKSPNQTIKLLLTRCLLKKSLTIIQINSILSFYEILERFVSRISNPFQTLKHGFHKIEKSIKI